MKLDIQTYVTEYLRNNIDAYGNKKNSTNIGIGYRTGLQQRAVKMVHPMFLTRIMRRYGGKHTCLDTLLDQVVLNVSWGSYDNIITVDVRNKVDFSVGMTKHIHGLLSIVSENLSYMNVGGLNTSQKNVFSRDTLMKDYKSYFYFYIDVKQLESYSLYSDTDIITQKPNLDGVVDFNNVSNMDFGMMAERIQCHAKRLLEEYESANAEINKWTKIRNEKSAEYQKFKKMFALD